MVVVRVMDPRYWMLCWGISMLLLVFTTGPGQLLPFFFPGADSGARKTASSKWVDEDDGCYEKEMHIASVYEQATFQYSTAIIASAIGYTWALRPPSEGEGDEATAMRNTVVAKVAVVFGLAMAWFSTGIEFVANRAESAQESVPDQVFGVVCSGWFLLLSLQLCITISGVVQLFWGPTTVQRLLECRKGLEQSLLDRSLHYRSSDVVRAAP